MSFNSGNSFDADIIFANCEALVASMSTNKKKQELNLKDIEKILFCRYKY